MYKFIFLFLLFTESSYAGVRPYYELGGGVSLIRSASPFFGDSAPKNLNLGTSIMFSLGLDFGSEASSMRFHFVIQERFSTGSDGTNFYSVHGPYGCVRLDGKRVFLTAGVAPILWQRMGVAAGIDSFNKATGTGVLGELGFGFPITPIVTFELITSGDIVINGGTISPKPIIGFLYGRKNIV
ncbi:MAG: hypothetical protein HY072_01640 [Deltaproteobacteria bacterium]|nr:hypothetical protein [Deltaproteobacteria bacterium]